MKFGIFYEMYVPPADLSDSGAEARIVRETVDQIVLADRLGWDYVWLTEHHFLKQFSHMSCAEVLFGAAAYATSHIRFGFGLALTPPKYNHPVRIAEKVAMLDCLSGGRVDLGTGRSTTPTELYGFEIDPDKSRAMWEEGLDAVTRLLANEDVELDGKYVKMPRRSVLPRPVQKPHPPLWVGGVSPGNAERAASKGLGMLFFAANTAPEALQESVAAYRENIKTAKPRHAGGVNNQTAGFINCLCTRDESQRDRVRWLAATKMVEHTFHGSTYMRQGWPDPDHVPESYAHVFSGESKMFYEAIKEDPDAVAREMLASGLVAAGTPKDCIEVLDRFRDVGVDQVIIHMQMGGVPNDDICETLEVMGTDVLPRYR